MSARPDLAPPTVGVLAVQGAFAEHGQALRRAGGVAREVRTAGALDGIDGLVIPGGESTTLGIVGGGSGLLGAIRSRVAEGLPTFGTCAGLIMLATRVVGAEHPLIGGLDIDVRRNAYGRQRASFEVDLEISAVGAPSLRAIFIRAPWVERVGPAVEVLAEYDGRPVAVRERAVIATAFHPELTADIRLHQYFLDTLREPSAGAGDSEGGTGVGT